MNRGVSSIIKVERVPYGKVRQAVDGNQTVLAVAKTFYIVEKRVVKSRSQNSIQRMKSGSEHFVIRHNVTRPDKSTDDQLPEDQKDQLVDMVPQEETIEKLFLKEFGGAIQNQLCQRKIINLKCNESNPHWRFLMRSLNRCFRRSGGLTQHSIIHLEVYFVRALHGNPHDKYISVSLIQE